MTERWFNNTITERRFSNTFKERRFNNTKKERLFNFNNNITERRLTILLMNGGLMEKLKNGGLTLLL